MEIRKTDDGSFTLWSEHYKETYHSTFGAATESNHVFIVAGLKQWKGNSVVIFEMGFGTGLNALLTYKEAQDNKLQIIYHAVELFPVSLNIIEKIEIDSNFNDVFLKMHMAEWNKEVPVSEFFTLKKIGLNLNEWKPETIYNVVYFDAFSPETQPELWTAEVFDKIYNMLSPGGILTTYCAKGIVRRNMIASGFTVERLPGPPGKREMLRAVRNI
jgi:tRNA U34 5-methylaminomethyl-2-thiouridine-forming methyltransferase MnmC